MKVTAKNENRFFGLVALVVVLNIAIWGGIVWAAGSAITSSVKAVSDSCGTNYPIEAVFSGDWFCAKEQ